MRTAEIFNLSEQFNNQFILHAHFHFFTSSKKHQIVSFFVAHGRTDWDSNSSHIDIWCYPSESTTNVCQPSQTWPTYHPMRKWCKRLFPFVGLQGTQKIASLQTRDDFVWRKWDIEAIESKWKFRKNFFQFIFSFLHVWTGWRYHNISHGLTSEVSKSCWNYKHQIIYLFQHSEISFVVQIIRSLMWKRGKLKKVVKLKCWKKNY